MEVILIYVNEAVPHRNYRPTPAKIKLMDLVMRLSPALLIAITVALPLSPVSAQVQVDVSKITCEQYLLFRITDPRNIAIWLSGYYHGKLGKTMIETEAFKDNSEKLKNYCYSHMNSSVMSGVESLWKEVK